MKGGWGLRTLFAGEVLARPAREAFSLKGGRPIAEGAVLIALVLWYVLSSHLPEYVLPHPMQVLGLTFQLFFDRSYVPHTYLSLARVLASVVIALGVGGGIVLFAYYVRPTQRLVHHRLTPFVNSFPSLGWAIVVVIWFGVSEFTVVTVETAILLPFCMINISEGLKNLDPELLEMARSFTRREMKVLAQVIIPLLFPFVVAAVRISYGVAWKVSLIAELFGAERGLGYLLNIGRQNYNTALVFSTIVAIIVMVSVVDRLVLDRVERLVLKHLETAR